MRSRHPPCSLTRPAGHATAAPAAPSGPRSVMGEMLGSRSAERRTPSRRRSCGRPKGPAEPANPGADTPHGRRNSHALLFGRRITNLKRGCRSLKIGFRALRFPAQKLLHQPKERGGCGQVQECLAGYLTTSGIPPAPRDSHDPLRSTSSAAVSAPRRSAPGHNPWAVTENGFLSRAGTTKIKGISPDSNQVAYVQEHGDQEEVSAWNPGMRPTPGHTAWPWLMIRASARRRQSSCHNRGRSATDLPMRPTTHMAGLLSSGSPDITS